MLDIVQEEIEEPWDEEWLLEMDKAWDAIHRCLTDGRLVDILVDQFTSIEPLTAESEFYGTLPLDASLIGRRVQIDAVPVTDGYLALWIVLPDYKPDLE